MADLDIRINHTELEDFLLEERRKLIRETQLMLVIFAQGTVHVITGNLRRSIHAGEINADATEGEVVADAKYGIHEHEGTRYRPAHPFFREAIDKMAARL